MGHIQQLAFALGPIEARTAAPQRPRPPSGRPPRPAAAAAQPLLLPEGSAPSPATPATPIDVVEPGLMAPAPVAAGAPAPAQTPPVAAAAAEPWPTTPAAPELLSDTGPAPIKAALYLVIGFARQRERRRSGWRRVAEQGFAIRRLAEEHAARLLARGRADGVVLTRQELGAEMDAADEPVILARLGELPAELLES